MKLSPLAVIAWAVVVYAVSIIALSVVTRFGFNHVASPLFGLGRQLSFGASLALVYVVAFAQALVRVVLGGLVALALGGRK